MIYLGLVDDKKLRGDILKLGTMELGSNIPNSSDIVITDAKNIMKYNFDNGLRAFIVLEQRNHNSPPYTIRDIKIAASILTKIMSNDKLTFFIGISGQIDYNIEVMQPGYVNKKIVFKNKDGLYGFEEYGKNRLYHYSRTDMDGFVNFILRNNGLDILELIGKYEIESLFKKEAK